VGSIPMHSRQLYSLVRQTFLPLARVESRPTLASLSTRLAAQFAVFEFLLPILVFLLPVLAVVAVALFCGRRLSGSCGGVGADGTCARCGRPAAEIVPPGSDGSDGSAACRR